MEYFIKVNITLSILYCFYQLALRNSAYLQANRIFLLSGLGLSFLLPALRLPRKDLVPEAASSLSRTVTLLNGQSSGTAAAALPDAAEASAAPFPAAPLLSWEVLLQGLTVLYIAVTAVLLLKLALTLVRLLMLCRKPAIKARGHRLIVLEDSEQAPFSFFSCVFISRKDLDRQDQWILRHELVHVKQWHSADLVLSEIVKALLWVNPAAYLYQRAHRLVNEQLADAVVPREERASYAELLYKYAHRRAHSGISHEFFNRSLLKRRVQMLLQKKSAKMRFAYLLVLPLMGILAFTVTRDAKPDSPSEPIASEAAPLLQASYFTVSGTVRDDAGQPVAGVTVKVEGTGLGTATDSEGNFSLERVSSEANLRFSMIGYETVQVPLNNSRIVNVRLQQQKQRLEELVVVGYLPESAPETKESEEVKESEGPVYSFVSMEKMPEFPGGVDSLIRHVIANFRYPDEARKQRLQGGVEVGFVVDENGKVTKPEILKGLGAGCDEEILRVISELPAWEPGEQNGRKVAVYYVLPFTLRLD